MTDKLETVQADPVADALAVVNDKVLAAELAQRKALGNYVRQCMVEDTDYGIIPGTQNKTLLKPGAEKLCGLFKCYASFEIIRRREDEDTGLYCYDFRCDVRHMMTDKKVAEGYGSCSSFEKKWRTIYEGKYPDRTPRNRTPDELWEVRNTVLKMAKKRALVDAAILLGRCSDLFTQDMEDAEQPAKPARQARRPRGGSREYTVPYGDHKGKKPSEIDEKGLADLQRMLSDALNDPKKEKFKALNSRGLAAVEAELEKRIINERGETMNIETGEVIGEPDPSYLDPEPPEPMAEAESLQGGEL